MEKENQALHEKIDSYLLHQMTIADRIAFEKEMQVDTHLRQKVSEQKKVIAAIQDFGNAEIRAYLRKNVQNKRVLSMTWKTWTYAAASVVLLCVGIGVLVISNQQKAENTTIANTTKNAEISNYPAIQQNTIDTTKPSLVFQPPPKAKVPSIGSVDDHFLPRIESTAEPDMQASADKPQFLIGRLNINPILVTEISSAPSLENIGVSKNNGQWDSGVISIQHPDYKFSTNGQTVTFNFLMNDSKQIEAELKQPIENSGSVSGEVDLVNIPYDKQAQVYCYKDKYYFKSGSTVYEIDLKLRNRGNVNMKKVSDEKILKALQLK